jgi:drug/metabolite transporter (DMT)-like permease
VNTSQWAFMALAVVGALFYHVSTKSAPADRHPFTILFHAYLTAGLLCLAILACTAPKELRAAIARPPVVSLQIGVAVLLIEAGFLLAYRSGWPVGWAALIQSMLLTVLLLPIGYYLYREEVSVARLAGVVLCLGGMALILKP